MLTLIVARARNGAIGRDGDIPWHAPEDLKLFQRETLGGAIIMGRNTWDSLPFRPLKNRLNCVVTSRDLEAPLLARDPVEAVETCYGEGYPRVYGIGGASIYTALLPLASRLMITEVDLDVPDADTFFPEFDTNTWEKVRSAPLRDADPKCTLTEWLRR